MGSGLAEKSTSGSASGGREVAKVRHGLPEVVDRYRFGVAWLPQVKLCRPQPSMATSSPAIARQSGQNPTRKPSRFFPIGLTWGKNAKNGKVQLLSKTQFRGSMCLNIFKEKCIFHLALSLWGRIKMLIDSMSAANFGGRHLMGDVLS